VYAIECWSFRLEKKLFRRIRKTYIMEILKIEEHNYKIIYINDDNNYNVYRRLNINEWEKFSVYKNSWYVILDKNEIDKLELALNQKNEKK
jgi:hypothetical protein